MSLSKPVRRFLRTTFACIEYNCTSVSFRTCLARRGVFYDFNVVCEKTCEGGECVEKLFRELLKEEGVSLKFVNAQIADERIKRIYGNRAAYVKTLNRRFKRVDNVGTETK